MISKKFSHSSIFRTTTTSPDLHEELQKNNKQEPNLQNPNVKKLSQLEIQKEELLKNLDAILEQKQRDQNHLNQKLSDEATELDKKHASEWDKITKERQSLETNRENTIDNDEKMKLQVEKLDNLELELRVKHEEERKKLGAKFRDKINIVEEEKQRMVSKFEEKLKDLNSEITKVRDTIRESNEDDEVVGRSQLLQKMNKSDESSNG